MTKPDDLIIKRPSVIKYIAEHFRVFSELRQSYKFEKTYQPKTKGDGHPVLVIPGFMGSDWSTGRVRKFIENLGYTTYGWELERNYGDISKLNVLLKRIEALHDQHQAQVSLLGWSLGGVYARQLAKARPELIRQILTMGSPFAGINEPNNAAWLYRLINKNRVVAEADKKWMHDIAAPAPVPTTAIYSKSDGIVHWKTCMEQEDDIHQNVEIKGGHFGLGHNPEVWLIIEDRLKYHHTNWQKSTLNKEY